MCHGEKGRGDGPVGQKFIPKPTDLSIARIQELGDEEIFLKITNGFQTMPSFKKDLAPQERWQIINHVRTLGVRGG
jgi:mono/diheme cytochrome c family protein